MPPTALGAAGGESRGFSAVLSPLASFVGRDREVTGVVRPLESGRLVTLTGPPGIGKARLAIEVATRLKARFRDGVCFVSLASIRDPALVVSAIGRARRVRELPGRPLVEALAEELLGRDLPLVLDNFEQVLPSASMLVNLLASAPRLHALVTSRAPPPVGGESVFQLPSLPEPDPAGAEEASAFLAASADNPAVRLFVAR